MPQCPDCQVELEDDFGIVDCKSCGTVCSVDLNGEVKVQGAKVEHQGESYEDIKGAAREEDLEEGVEEVHNEPGEVSFYEEGGSEDLTGPVSEEIKPDTEESTSMMGTEFLKDLEFFTEESTSEEFDHVYYDLKISEVKDWELLVEVLADERLEITQEYLSELKGDGLELVVPQLSFLRLSVVYKRLLHLGVKMLWTLSEEQHPQTQEEALKEDEEQDYGTKDLIE